MKLLLFDIDGTLLIGRSNIYRDPLNRAGQEVFHPNFSVDLLNRLGSLDADIIDEALTLVGVVAKPEQIEDFQRRYFSYLTEAAPTGTVLPGVRELLDELERREDVVLGLVTGNYQESAKIKIEGLGLNWNRFPVGGFGDEKTTRAALVRRAIDEAEQRFNCRFSTENVIVIGDTLKDIGCARKNNCPIIAVASGWTSREELASENPDLLLDNLEQIDEIFSFCGLQRRRV